MVEGAHVCMTMGVFKTGHADRHGLSGVGFENGHGTPEPLLPDGEVMERVDAIPSPPTFTAALAGAS